MPQTTAAPRPLRSSSVGDNVLRRVLCTASGFEKAQSSRPSEADNRAVRRI